MSEDNNVLNENTPEEDENLNWPTFDYNEQNWPANRLYVTETTENATPGSHQRREDPQGLILKFDWYFSNSVSEIQSREFTVPNSGKKFFFRARSSPWMKHGKHVQVDLLIDVCKTSVGLGVTAKLRSPDWKSVEEFRACHEFSDGDENSKKMELFSIKGEPVDVWPVDPTTELVADTDLIPRVYAIKGTLRYIGDKSSSWKLVTNTTLKNTDSEKLDVQS